MCHLGSGDVSKQYLQLDSQRTAPLQMATLFLDNFLKKAEEDIACFESKQHSCSFHKKDYYHPYERQEKHLDSSKSDKPAWNNIGPHGQGKRQKGKVSHYLSQPAKCKSSYSVNAPVYAWRLTECKETANAYHFQKIANHCKKTVKACQREQTLNIYLVILNHAHIVKGQPQKKAISPDCSLSEIKICERCFLCRSPMSKLLLKIYL